MNRASLDKVINGTRDERVFLCEQDFALFFCYYMIDYIKYRFAPFHFDMFKDVEDLMSDILRELAWIEFRESAKTSLAKGLLLWIITYKKFRYVNVDSFDKENAERVLFDLVVTMQINPRFLADFGNIYNTKRSGDEATQKRVNNFVTNTGVRVEAHSTGESVRGRLHQDQRPDFLLLDDFETNKTKDSAAHTKQVIDHINEFKGGLDGMAKVLYLGNYITEFGSVNTLKERAKTDVRLRYRQVDAEMMVDGVQVPSWPQKYVMTNAEAEQYKREHPTMRPKISLEDKKRQLTAPVYSAEMMNCPVDEASQKFFRKFFKYKPLAYLEDKRTRLFALIDTAISKKSGSDNTGVSRVNVDENNYWYVRARRYRINAKGLVDLIFQLHDEGCEKIGIEETAYTEAVAPFFEDECRLRNKYPHVVMLSHGGINKNIRIEGLVPKYEAGHIYHIEGECDELEEELLQYPRAPHDDVPDSLAYGLKLCEPAYPQHSQDTSIAETVENLYDDIGL